MVAEMVKTEGYEVPLMVQGMKSIFLDVQRWEFAKKVASMLAASSMVPRQFQGPDGVGNCMIAMNLAERMGVDVFMLMQTLYVVHGRPGLEGKLIVALVNGCGRFEPLEFEQEGKGKTKKGIPRPERVRAFGKELKSKKVLSGPWVSWDMAEAEGWTADKGSGPSSQTSKWQTMPELMFYYRSATFFARVYCPEVLMGLRTKEELDDSTIDVTPTQPKIPETTEKKGETIYDLKKVQTEQPPKPESQAPEKPQVETSEPMGSNLSNEETPQIEATEVKTDVMDEETRIFIEEAQKYEAELHKPRWQSIIRYFGIAHKGLKDLTPDSRERFIQQAKTSLEKQTEKK